MRNKDVSEKYDVYKNISTWLKITERFFRSGKDLEDVEKPRKDLEKSPQVPQGVKSETKNNYFLFPKNVN